MLSHATGLEIEWAIKYTKRNIAWAVLEGLLNKTDNKN